MELVGQILKETREAKKISLSEVSEELKISKDILISLENQNFQSHIDIIFIIGHLRSYCSYLDLNQIEIVEKFKKEHLPKKNIKIEIEKPKIANNFLFSNKIISFSLIIIIFISFYFLFIEVDKPSREYAIIPDLPENYVSIVEEANLNNLIKNNEIKDLKENNFAKSEQNSNSSSAIASIPKKHISNSDLITLKFLDDTWIQLRDKNDEIIFSQLMNKNDEYSYKLDLNYSITSGNAGHILVLVNKLVKGKLGKKGQVVDSLVLDKDFNN